MKVNILSDLHLGVASIAAPDNDGDIVVLAGDIGRPAQGVAWATSLARPVLYVAGNHEFYGGSIDGTLAELRRLCGGTNVQLLDDDEMVIGGVRFIGSTLWTDFLLLGERERERAMHAAQRFIHDFSRIRVRESADPLFTPGDAAARFTAHRKFLAERLDTAFDGPTVVITHHAPSPRSIHPRFADSALNACFVSNLEPLISEANVSVWIHGHTHDSFDYTVNGTRVVCNPRGYARNGVDENAAFDPDLIVEVG